MAKIRNPLMVINVTEGGTTPPVEQETYLCRVVDWEGTILKEEWLPSGATFTMPADPTYEGLVFDGWSSPVDIVDNQVVVEDMDIIIGAMYYTASGLTEVDIELTEVTGLDITFRATNGTINWGDGTSDNLTTHTYTEYGKYTITTDCTSLSSSSSNNVFGASSSNQNYTVKSIRLGNNITRLQYHSFQYFNMLENILIPKSITNIANEYVFGNCVILKALVIPNSVSVLADLAYYTHRLEHLVIPNSVTNLNRSVVDYCYCLEYISLPKNIIIGSNAITSVYGLKRIVVDTSSPIGGSFLTYAVNLKSVKIKNTPSIGKGFCQNAYVLTDINLPDTLETLGSAFENGYSMYNLSFKVPTNVTSYNMHQYARFFNIIFNENVQTITQLGANSYCRLYDFSKTKQVPTLSSTFTMTPAQKIVVPDALYDEWIVASGWSDFANYIVKASEYQN